MMTVPALPSSVACWSRRATFIGLPRERELQHAIQTPCLLNSITLDTTCVLRHAHEEECARRRG